MTLAMSSHGSSTRRPDATRARTRTRDDHNVSVDTPRAPPPMTQQQQQQQRQQQQHTDGHATSPAVHNACAATPARAVVHVVRPRMVTRALLKGTSPMLDELAAEAAAAAAAATTTTTTAALSASAPASAAHSHSTRQTTAAASSDVRGGINDDNTRAATAARVLVVGGVLRCVCNAFLLSAQESLIECCCCRNYCHPACVGLDHGEVRVLQRQRSYVCPYCTNNNNNNKYDGSDDRHSSATDALRHDDVEATLYSSNSGAAAAGSAAPAGVVAAAAATSLSRIAHAIELTSSNSSNNNAVSMATATVPLTFGAGRQPPAPRQTPLKLREVPDCVPRDRDVERQLRALLQRMYAVAQAMGYEVVDVPPAATSTTATMAASAASSSCPRADSDVVAVAAAALSPQTIDECLACCEQAVHDATFSASYPRYCLREVCARLHPYVQGTLLRERDGGVVRALVLTNGMDVYGNLRSTIAQLKSDYHRGRLEAAEVTTCMRRSMAVTDVSDFVHVTLSATHRTHQRRGLARVLMTMELLKWALRGRTRAYLNMAIEKRLVEGGTRVECVASPASRRLYHGFGFADVYPRYDRVTGAERWTPREADMGRVMVQHDFVPDVVRIATALCEAASSPDSLVARPRRVHDDADGGGTRVEAAHGTATDAWRSTDARPRRALRLCAAATTTTTTTAASTTAGTRRERSSSSSNSSAGGGRHRRRSRSRSRESDDTRQTHDASRQRRRLSLACRTTTSSGAQRS